HDWRVVGMDLLSVWILAYYFHGWIAASRRPG
ncbi:MAG: hypothetical protein JWO25_1101, partial [Alphaproteobacteria bacterium]|nr:hypothetical protein [Alphaproteobacteria bacterium]